jgi:DNA invertase Pin-like site-specific DNA recombinase
MPCRVMPTTTGAITTPRPSSPTTIWWPRTAGGLATTPNTSFSIRRYSTTTDTGSWRWSTPRPPLLHDLGEVTVIADPGLSGKNLERPGRRQLLHTVNQGHVANVLTWRLDRLSRNLSDLILLADQFGQRGVALHSFTEKIDLSSATGRMFYNILGSFAQFYREQLAENVRMGMHQAVRQGKWINRPKTGYDLIDGELVPNEMAPVVKRIFAMRNDGASQTEIADATGVNYSTVLSILHSRIYLGEVQLTGESFPGHHEPLITPRSSRPPTEAAG